MASLEMYYHDILFHVFGFVGDVREIALFSAVCEVFSDA
jgi:hypothetical protein